MNQNNNENYIVVNAKVSKPAAAMLQQLAKAKGLSIYGIIQMVVDTLIRYMSEDSNLSAEIEKAMSIFEHMEGWSDALNWADPSADKEIGEATYFMIDPEGQRKGCRAVHVLRPCLGDWQQDVNIQHIIERTLELLVPERYRRMRMAVGEMGYNSLLEMLDELIDTHTSEAETAEIRRTFEDANRSEFGRPIEYGKRFVRKHAHHLNDEPTMFDDQQL